MNLKKLEKQSQIIVAELQKRSKKALEFAKKRILTEKMESAKLHDALEYYVSGWNEFTHPGLFSLACEAVGGDPDAAVQVQAAMTLMAAAFDIHDDIIDNSKAKHGVPTVFGKFGKDIALLLGNAFLIEGFGLFSKSLEGLHQKRAKVFEILQTSLFELGNAHALELDIKRRSDATPKEYMKIVKMKAASIEADMRIGAIVGGGNSSEVEALSRYARTLGMLGTLREEFIDVFEVEELNQRIYNEYLPIPVLYSMQDSDSRRRIKELLAKGKVRNSDLDEFIRAVLEAKSVRKLKKEIAEFSAEAVQLISNIKNDKLRDLLRKLILSTLEDL
ncbi:MAG: polyprenyl synthetase family protein [Candidatus Bathyarchaeota archaeon]|nr:polyprenyl synthetase family protein [Candidatus Bathyarchaeota archaeon]MDH5787222.1 polyprenyl synthetase family protein [Candidatus Bathyarchaeota archaeon]